MHRFMKLFFALAFTSSLAVPHALAHAFLDHAVPGVGESVSAPLHEIRLYYTEGVVPAFSRVHVKSATGPLIPVSKPVTDPSDHSIVIVRFNRPLGPGSYAVSWRVTSVDSHVTQGIFHFTVQ
jgi:methionine-rich copper-binding protein CopC